MKHKPKWNKLDKKSKENWKYIILTISCLKKLNDNQKKLFFENKLFISI